MAHFADEDDELAVIDHVGDPARAHAEPVEVVVPGGLLHVRVLAFDLPEYVFGALRAGAAGFLSRNAEAKDLIEAVRTVARGEGLIPPTVTPRRIAELATGPVQEPRTDPAVLDVLTRREREALSCLGEGLSNAETARRLDMAEATVKTHVSRLLGRLGLRSRVQAAVLAQELGIQRTDRHSGPDLLTYGPDLSILAAPWV